MIVTTKKHSYFVNDLATVELGSTVLDLEKNQMYMHLNPVVEVASVEELANAIAAGGNIKVAASIAAPTGFVITSDLVITNEAEISIPEDTVGDGVFKVTAGVLTLDGKGTINGLDSSGWSMAVWATENGKVIIKDGYFTNVGAYSPEDSEHYDLIYASGHGQVEILGGEFKCETPKWILNIKNADRETASIVVKGGKFHGFNPMEAEEGNFVAPGYKVVEEDGVFIVMPE